jgi:hypothetical protein
MTCVTFSNRKGKKCKISSLDLLDLQLIIRDIKMNSKVSMAIKCFQMKIHFAKTINFFGILLTLRKLTEYSLSKCVHFGTKIRGGGKKMV